MAKPDQVRALYRATTRRHSVAYMVEHCTGLSAYSPDLPGCVATAATREEVEKEMHDAIEFHLEGLRLEGQPVPMPRSEASYCEVA